MIALSQEINSHGKGKEVSLILNKFSVFRL